ncbi:MAG TPA: DUF3472 domain-containing protein [Arachidicoccus sp.]|nr:DUF3472 domain-containing protein [Arachidicoccus sp.]
MKTKTRFLYGFGAVFCCAVSFACKAQSSLPSKVLECFTVPANKGYVEPFSANEHSNSGVSVPVGYPETKGVVSRWSDKGKSVVWYLYQKQGDYNFLIDTKVLKNRPLAFTFNISNMDPKSAFTPVKKQLKLAGKGVFDTVLVTRITIPETGYYRYAMTPDSDPASAITIRSLYFESYKPGAQVHQTDYQSSPSVHLSFSATAPTTKSYDWIYGEILVPKGGDPLATYYMSLGFYRGYMGIQTNSAKERRVLFSVWDSKDAEKDSSIQKSDLVSLVGKGPATVVNNFGGEGTGGQSYVPTANWKTGEPVKFLMNIKAQADNAMIVSAWYKLSGEDWKYVASWRAPKEQRYFDGYYSFLENYGYGNGQLRREAYYYNNWGKESGSGKWVNFNKVRFSHTDGKPGQRVDYEQGVAAKYPNRFYMASGGYTPTVQTADEIPVSNRVPIPDLRPFEAQVTKSMSASKKL